MRFRWLKPAANSYVTHQNKTHVPAWLNQIVHATDKNVKVSSRAPESSDWCNHVRAVVDRDCTYSVSSNGNRGCARWHIDLRFEQATRSCWHQSAVSHLVVCTYEMNADKLIHAVYKRPELWDPKHIGHNNRMLVNKLWQEVAEEVGTDSKLIWCA